MAATWGEARARGSPASSPSCLSACVSHMQSGIAEEKSGAKDPASLTRAERLALKSKISESWRLRLGHALESHYAHAICLLIIFADVNLTLCEVMIREVCPTPYQGFSKGSWQESRLHNWGKGLSWASLSMLFLLLAHQLGLMLAFGLAFFQKWAYVVDFLIVAVALSLEFAHMAEEAAGGHHRRLSEPAHSESHGDGVPEVSNLIIVLLVWRILRVIHGFTMSALEHADDQELREAKSKITELEGELKKYRGAPQGNGTSGGELVASLTRSPAPAGGTQTNLV